jgi:hypothetical protein
LHGYSYLFDIIDCSTRWVQAVLIKNLEASICVDFLVAVWISRFGVPYMVTSDRGTQFMSSTWESVCFQLGMEHITTTAYHPHS